MDWTVWGGFLPCGAYSDEIGHPDHSKSAGLTGYLPYPIPRYTLDSFNAYKHQDAASWAVP